MPEKIREGGWAQVLEQYRIGRLTAALGLVCSGFVLWLRVSGRTAAAALLWRYWPVLLVILALEVAVATRPLYQDDRPGPAWDFAAIACVCVLVVAAGGMQLWGIRRARVNQFADPFNDNRFTINTEQSLVLAEANRLYIENSTGKVKVKVGNEGNNVQVDMEVIATGDNGKEAESLARGVKLKPTTVDKQLKLMTEFPTLKNNQELTCNITINLPPQALDMEILNHFGAVEVEDGQGSLRVEDKNGSITVTNQRGAATLATDFGNVRVKGVSADLGIQAGNGTVDVEQVKGSAVVRSSFGRVELRKVEGKVDVEARNGGVALSDVAGDLTITSTFGSTEINNPKRQVTVKSDNGSVTVISAEPLQAPMKLESKFGNIRVRVPKASDLQVDAASEFGRLELPAGITVNKEGNRSSAQGSIGANGPSVFLHSDNGSITLEMR